MASASNDPGEGQQRRERTAIAAQACQTCRNRKSRCDEQRPKCGLCRRLSVECEYREPLPTKKDKTMVHILDTLHRLENKFDTLSLAGSPSGYTAGSGTPSALPSVSEASSSQPSLQRGSRRDSDHQRRDLPAELQQSYQHLTVPHKIMLWPGIYIHLVNSGIQAASDLQYILQEGTPWFIKQEMVKHPNALPADVGLPSYPVNPNTHEANVVTYVNFPTLTVQQIQEYSSAYFNSFNVLFPLLNQELFMNEIVVKLLREGYSDGDPGTVLALLVFALGQVAIEGVFDRPISTINGQASGFRGGSAERPPGLGIFNEARRRLGFIATQCTLENVQIMLLQAIYFESHARHLDFWRSTVAASMACQVLIRCQPIDWTSSHGDLVKRAYWTCVLSEDLYHLDLDLPKTGIHTLEDEVPLPYFHVMQEPGFPPSPLIDERSHFQYHFLAMIALRRLITRIHGVIYEYPASTAQAESTDYGGPPVPVIREMVRQLDSWRALLPRPLQWSDTERFEFPPSMPNTQGPHQPLFSSDQGPIPIAHTSNLDIATAQLRTRFYYARFMMYRPFVYKALHFPELMTPDDVNCCGMAIKSACLWPLSMAPPKNKKRLVPHLFAWTQNFMGILLILRMTVENECLRAICDGQIDRGEIDRSVDLMLDWVRDVKQVDGVAEWSWSILEPLYSNQTA